MSAPYIEEDDVDDVIDLDGESSILIGPCRTIGTLRCSASTSDGVFTDTFDEQVEVENGVLAIYETFVERQSFKHKHMPTLSRENHSFFLRSGLKRLSDAYETLDASRPWLCYWILHSMNLLAMQVSKAEAVRISKFLKKCQNYDCGGFGGGVSQFSHLAATYAAVNALVSLGIPETMSVIDRPSLLRFLKSMKLPDGSFRMHRGGEVDVRAVYCAVVVANLTNLCSDDLFAGTAEWIVRCQTYEGGFAGFIGGEAHGGYTFCAVAALVLLKGGQLMDQECLLKWLVGRQLSLEGGFQGRTNKLVDGCYSFWQGACFCLLGKDFIGVEEGNDPHWLFNQLALQEYILICCQHPHGGLIDKPGKTRDYYHTCYTLSGLSIAQNSPGIYKVFLENKQTELKKVNPVFNLTVESVSAAQTFFYGTTRPPFESTINDVDL